MERQIIKNGIKNTYFVVFAQAVVLILGIAKALILPILLGVTNFGYWQVYLLYTSYLGIFAFGFNDGIYLRYGKYEYHDLPKPLFRSSIRIFVFIQILFMFFVLTIFMFEPDINKRIALIWVSVNIPIFGLSGVLKHILQVTNKLKSYSFYTVLDRIILLAIILLVFLYGANQHIIIIVADTFAKIAVLSLMIYSNRDIIFGKASNVSAARKEIFQNSNAGIKVMFASLSGMLVLGFGRFIVERFESVEIYGTYSFAISTINLILVFIAAIGLVIYPTLNRLNHKKYAKYFIELNQVLRIVVFGLLLAYFPLTLFITKFMKDYINIFEYLPIIFAIVFIQTKMQIIINPYYKLLREEKAMLGANILGVVSAVALIIPSYFISNSVFMIALGTFLAMGIRLYLSEIYLKKILDIKEIKNILFEIVGIIIFISLAYQDNLFIGFIGYLACYLLYFIYNLKSFIKYIKYIF